MEADMSQVATLIVESVWLNCLCLAIAALSYSSKLTEPHDSFAKHGTSYGLVCLSVCLSQCVLSSMKIDL